MLIDPLRLRESWNLWDISVHSARTSPGRPGSVLCGRLCVAIEIKNVVQVHCPALKGIM